MSHGVQSATFLMRWWKKKHDKLLHIALTLKRGLELEDENVHLLREVFLEWRGERPAKVELSVYACAQQDATDPGHALGVVAVTLPLLRSKPDKDHDKEVNKRSGATLLIERAALVAAGFTPQHTPQSCHTLCVAAPHHWDLVAEDADVERLYDLFCDQLKLPTRIYKIDPAAKTSATEQPFKDQAKLALDVCCDPSWALRADGSCGGAWCQAGEWSVREQIDALLRLARFVGYDVPA